MSTQLSDSNIYFRAVSVGEIFEKYLRGGYSHVTEPIPMSAAQMTQVAQNASAQNSPTKSLVTTVETNLEDRGYIKRNAAGVYYACLGYHIYDKSGAYQRQQGEKIYNCLYCIRPIENIPIGIPIRREVREITNSVQKQLSKSDSEILFKTPNSFPGLPSSLSNSQSNILVEPENSFTADRKQVVFFHCIDTFCSFNCMYAVLEARRGNRMYASSYEYVKEMFVLCTGLDIKKLRPANDDRFVWIKNGPMSWEEFHQEGSVTFSAKPSSMALVEFLPALLSVEQDY